MRLDQLVTTQVSAETLGWLKEKYSVVDRMDGPEYRKFLAPDCQLMFGNNPIVQCNNEIIGGIQHFWDAIGGMDHSFLHVLGTDHHLSAEARIDYTRKDGRVVTLPCVTVIQRNDIGQAVFIRIFIDTAPVFQP